MNLLSDPKDDALLICQCGNTFVEPYHPDWPELCSDCAIKEIRYYSQAWIEWFNTLTTREKRIYFNNGPYTLQQVKEMMFNTKDEAI